MRGAGRDEVDGDEVDASGEFIFGYFWLFLVIFGYFWLCSHGQLY
jgi:hypothetical protein